MARSQNNRQPAENYHGFPFGVVFLHGLNGDRDEISYVTEGISNKYGNRAIYIQPTSREKWRSVIYSASYQIKGVVKEINHELTQKHNASKFFPIIIIGYSDGGRLAFKLLKDFGRELNIIGVNTLNGALNGAHILTCSQADVQAFLSEAKDGLELLNCPHSTSSVKRNMGLLSFGLTMMRPQWMPVPVLNLKDMLPGCASVREVSSFINSGANGIPCFLVATHQNDFGELFNIEAPEDKEVIEHFSKAYSKLITGSEQKHDTLLSVKTQLCRGDSLESLYGSAENPVVYVHPSHSNITGRIYQGKTHAGNLVPIDDDLFFPGNFDSTVTSKEILEDVIKFIDYALREFEGRNFEQYLKTDDTEIKAADGTCRIM